MADAISLDDLADLSLDERLGRLLPTDVMLGHLPMLRLTMDETARIKMGQRLNVKDRLDDLNFGDDAIQIRLYHDDDFVGLGQVAMSGRLQPIKVVHCY